MISEKIIVGEGTAYPLEGLLTLPETEKEKGTQHYPDNQYEGQLMQERCCMFELSFHIRKKRRSCDLRSLRSGRDSNSRPPA